MMHNAVCSSETHEAMKRDEAVWASLEHIGVQYVDGLPFLLLANCGCGSTLARLVSDLCPCPPVEGEEVH